MFVFFQLNIPEEEPVDLSLRPPRGAGSLRPEQDGHLQGVPRAALVLPVHRHQGEDEEARTFIDNNSNNENNDDNVSNSFP